MLDVVVLPCVPGHGDGRAQPGELAEELRAVQLAQAALARRRRARGCRRGIAEETTTSAPSGTLAASCPTRRLDARGAQAGRVRGVARAVRARDGRAERPGDERQAAHPGPADAHEVQPPAGPWASGRHAAHRRRLTAAGAAGARPVSGGRVPPHAPRRRGPAARAPLPGGPAPADAPPAPGRRVSPAAHPGKVAAMAAPWTGSTASRARRSASSRCAPASARRSRPCWPAATRWW